MKPTKLLLRLVHVDGKMEENGTESPVNEEKQIVHESSDNWKDNGNSVPGNSNANGQDYSSATHDNNQQNSFSAAVNQPFILVYSSATPGNYQQCWSSAVANQPLILAPFNLETWKLGMFHICSFQFRNMPSFDTILLWYANMQHVNLKGVVNEMLIKQNINISSSCFITWSTNCQQNCWTAIVNNRHHSDLWREDITLPNLTKHDLDDDLRCQNEIDL